MVKDGCNNTEKNKILSLHDQGLESDVIARGMALTERIVENMIWYYRKGGKEEKEAERAEAELEAKSPKKVKAKSKAKKKSTAETTAEEDFK